MTSPAPWLGWTLILAGLLVSAASPQFVGARAESGARNDSGERAHWGEAARWAMMETVEQEIVLAREMTGIKAIDPSPHYS